MFSPVAATGAHSTRPKRTRQAAGNDDSVKLPQAKRKRSALRRDTFEPLAEASINEIAGRQNGETRKSNGHAPETKANASQPAAQSRELTFRGGKKPEKRVERGGTALLLSSNDFYTVSQLPALPDQIRGQKDLKHTCLLSPEHGYALALTHTDALLWPYNTTSSVPSPRDLSSFKLPLPPCSANEPLPLASFTAKNASGEPGLIVVSAKWGKIVYWETLTNTSTIIPGQASDGVQGSVPGMSSGEVVKEIVNAEPSGYILTTNKGRAAHLSVIDQMGRPAISVQNLQKPPSDSGGAFFGSIRNVFGGKKRNGTPIVKAGGATKGQRNIVVVTEDGDLEEWDTSLTGMDSLKANLSLKESLYEALAPQVQVGTNATPLHFNVLDFELASTQQSLLRRESMASFPLIALVSFSTNGQSKYYIVEMAIRGTEATVRVVHPIKCYSEPVSGPEDQNRPSLLVAKSQQLAFVIFETAVVIFSLAKIEESPTSQILNERHELPEPFQDCIRLQESVNYKIIGHASEEYDQKPALLLPIWGFGIIRVISKLRDVEENDEEIHQDTISAKSKIEQAVFFGTMKSNPLDLSRGTEDAFTSEEVEAAAKAISSEILASSSRYLPKSMPSVELQMKQRAKALDDLIGHLMKQYRAKISRNLQYELLWNAEKLAAAQALWKVQEDIQRRYPLEDREMSYLDFCLRALHETRQKYPDAEKGEKDRVRFWLYNSVENISYLLAELADCFKELEDMDVTDPRIVGEYMKEAMDLWVAAYTAAFKFREDNAAQYGLGDDVFKNGVLAAGYPLELEYPWTSTREVFKFAQQMLVALCAYMNEWWTFDPQSKEGKKKKMPTSHIDGKAHDAPPKATLKDIAAELPDLVELFNRLVTEQIIQASKEARRDPDEKTGAERASQIRSKKRQFQTGAILEIRHFNMPGAIDLAEDLRDTPLLVTLTTEFLRKLTIDAHMDPQHTSRYQAKIREVQDRAEGYYDEFGKSWAVANYSYMVQDGQLGTLFTTAQSDEEKQKYLTWFLEKMDSKGEKVGKLSWINEIVGEQNFIQAEQALANVAVGQERDMWNKRTQLALAKLTNLAAMEEKTESGTDAGKEDFHDVYDDQMDLLEMQAAVQSHVLAGIGPFLDAKAAEDLAVENFATRVVAKKPQQKAMLKALLRAILEEQPLSGDGLMDLLTLMDPVQIDDNLETGASILGNEFSMALRAINLSNKDDQYKAAMRQIVWRRAMVRDDWIVLNETTNKSDDDVEREMQESSIFRTLLQVFEEAANIDAGGNLAALAETQLCSPVQVLEAGVLPAAMAKRFGEDSKTVDSVKKDYEKEYLLLKKYVEKAQLEKHWSGLVPLAQKIVKDAFDEDGEEMAEEVLEEGIEE